MAESLFSDIPVGGSSNFQGRVDQMCREINEDNITRQEQEASLKEIQLLEQAHSVRVDKALEDPEVQALIATKVDAIEKQELEDATKVEVPIEEKKVEEDDTLSNLTT